MPCSDRFRYIYGAAATSLVIAFVTLPATAGTLTFQNTSEFSSGHYGDPQATDSLYEAIAAKYQFGSTFLKVTAPFLYVKGPGNVVPDFGSISSGVAPITSRSGWGDIMATADQTIHFDFLPHTDFDLIGKVKFATASAKKGLGTGENDYYLQLEWTQYLTDKFSTIVDFGRRFVESGPEIGLHDVWYGSVGASWDLQKDLALDGYFDMRQPTSPTSGSQLEGTLQIAKRFQPGWKATLYGSKGFASGSADITVGIILAKSFSL